jgi:hypothetical protein
MDVPPQHRPSGLLSECLVPIGLMLGFLAGGAGAAGVALLCLRQISGGVGTYYGALTEGFLVLAASFALGAVSGAALGGLIGAAARNALDRRAGERQPPP